MQNRNQQGDGPEASQMESLDSEQLAQVQAMLAGQQEATTVQIRGIQAQIVHMLMTSLRVLSNATLVPDKDKKRLAKKLVVAMDRHLGRLPDEDGTCESCPKDTTTKKTPEKKRRRGMGFGANV